MKRMISFLTLTFFLLGQVAVSDAAFSFSQDRQLRTPSAKDGGNTVPSILDALTGRISSSAQDGDAKVTPFTDSAWRSVPLAAVPQTPTDIARAIDGLGIKYILNQWTLVGMGRDEAITGRVPTAEKGNLIVVGPNTRPLLEVGIPTDRSSYSSGFGEQYGTIYDSDGMIRLQPQTLRVYEHPDLGYKVATVDGYVVPTDDPRNVRTALEGSFEFEKEFQPLVSLDLSPQAAADRVIDVLQERKTKEVVLLVSDSSGDLKEVRYRVNNSKGRAELKRALLGESVIPVGDNIAKGLLTSTPKAGYFVAPDAYTLMEDPFDVDQMMLVSEVQTEDGKPFENDTRYRMRQFLQKLWQEYRHVSVVGLEPEWFLISRDADGNPIPTDFNLYYDRFQDHPAEVQEVLLKAVEAITSVGISITNTTSEVAGSQHEWVIEAKFPPKHIDPGLIGKPLPFQHLSALRTLDDFMLYKYLLKRTAALYGKEITFEAKPFAAVNGSGMHTHLSFWQADEEGNLKNLFADPESGVELSSVGQSAAEGVMRAGREMFVFTNQNHGDQFRHVAGFEAPVLTGFISEENRSSPIRRPKTTSPSGVRFEYRVPAPDDNMYLSTGTILSAAHQGIVQSLPMRQPVVGRNLYHMLDEDPDSLIPHLPEGETDITKAKVPANFEEAVSVASSSHTSGGMIAQLESAGYLTRDLVDQFLRTRREQLAKPVREPVPFPESAPDGGSKYAGSRFSYDEIRALLQTESVTPLASARIPVSQLGPRLEALEKPGTVLITDELLAADPSLVERLSNWPDNVPVVLISRSGLWRKIVDEIVVFSNGAQLVPWDKFAAVITPETSGIRDINDVRNIVEIVELKTESPVVAYAVESALRPSYERALPNALGISYTLPKAGSNQVALGAQQLNRLLSYLAAEEGVREELLEAWNHVLTVQPTQLDGDVGEYLLSYDSAVRGL